MSNFSTQEIESQYNLNKKLLSNKIKYKEEIHKDIVYMPLELKEKLERKIFFYKVKNLLISTKLKILKKVKVVSL